MGCYALIVSDPDDFCVRAMRCASEAESLSRCLAPLHPLTRINPDIKCST